MYGAESELLSLNMLKVIGFYGGLLQDTIREARQYRGTRLVLGANLELLIRSHILLSK